VSRVGSGQTPVDRVRSFQWIRLGQWVWSSSKTDGSGRFQKIDQRTTLPDPQLPSYAIVIDRLCVYAHHPIAKSVFSNIMKILEKVKFGEDNFGHI